jgi:hypothetical protein
LASPEGLASMELVNYFVAIHIKARANTEAIVEQRAQSNVSIKNENVEGGYRKLHIMSFTVCNLH